MITFKDLQDRVLRAIDEYDSDQTHTRERIKESINAAHRRVYYTEQWPWSMWPKEETFTTTDGVDTYALHTALGRLRTLYNRTTGSPAVVVPVREWEQLGVNRSQSVRTQEPDFVLGPTWPVRYQPVPTYDTTGTQILITPSESADTAAGDDRAINLEGITTAGLLRREQLVPDGSSTLTSANSYAHLTQVSREGTWTGSVLVSTLDDTEVLVTLYDEDEAMDYPTLQTTELPAAGLVFAYTFQRRCRELVEDGDLPEIKPNDLAEVLVYEALIEEATYNTEIPSDKVSIWMKRRDALLVQLGRLNDSMLAGGYPRFVRDLSGTARTVLTPS